MAIDLKSISKNTAKPPRIAIYGPPGVGKTTFAANAPEPIFILTEDGLGDLDVKAIPTDESGKSRIATTFDEVLECLQALGEQEHNFKTVVIDSLDALETLVWAATCKRLGVSSIEAPGWGKGYVEAQNEWRTLFSYITALRDEKNMAAIFIAHSSLTRIEDPEHPAYDTNTLKLHKRASALATEYCDVVGFASLKMFTKIEDVGKKDEKRARAIADPKDQRILRLSVSPAFVGKNRYHMPESVPLVWEEFAKHLPNGGK